MTKFASGQVSTAVGFGFLKCPRCHYEASQGLHGMMGSKDVPVCWRCYTSPGWYEDSRP